MARVYLARLDQARGIIVLHTQYHRALDIHRTKKFKNLLPPSRDVMGPSLLLLLIELRVHTQTDRKHSEGGYALEGTKCATSAF